MSVCVCVTGHEPFNTWQAAWVYVCVWEVCEWQVSDSVRLTCSFYSFPWWAYGTPQAEVKGGEVPLLAAAHTVVCGVTGINLFLDLRASIITHQAFLYVVPELRVLRLAARKTPGGNMPRTVGAHVHPRGTFVASYCLTRLCIFPGIRGSRVLARAWHSGESC